MNSMNDDQSSLKINRRKHEPEDVQNVDLLPSIFLRKLRPEYYSDSSEVTVYELDQPTLEYHLETITQRNQTHDFEIFCRKLCERVICPNLRPATGPEGGGDSKVDSETYAVAEEISELIYVGEPKAGSERWAFAFSAKERWADKVRKDVKGIVGTGRSYDRIICVTSRFARAKTRANLEDSLTKRHRIPIEIHDRTWIVKEIIEENRKDLAVNFLGVGREFTDTAQLGPADYSRSQQLRELESALANPTRFEGMETQSVTEALLAAKLARGLEHSRSDIEARFERARRLARKFGTHRQRLEVQYEIILTAFWWYDDFAFLNSSYDQFESVMRQNEHVRNIEFLSTIGQLLVISVIHGHITLEESTLIQRSDRLRERLESIARQKSQPNSALEASTMLLIWRLNLAVVLKDSEKLPAIWSDFSDILERAKPMAEYNVDRVTKLITIVGEVAGSDPAYNLLVEKMAAFVSHRKSEAEGARIIARRAHQLELDQCFEMIRLLGKAIPKLTKREYANDMINAVNLLALSYRKAGLLWAARATCLMAMARIVSEAEDKSELTVDLIPVCKLWAWLSLELRHLPDLLTAMKLLGQLEGAFPLTDDSRKKFLDDFQQIDFVLANHILNCTDQEIKQLEVLPFGLDRASMHFSRSALLYSLGYGELLRDEGSILENETNEELSAFFSAVASKPLSRRIQGPLICYSEEGQNLETKILGLSVRIHCGGSQSEILLAELVAGAVEAFLATTPELDVVPHTEEFVIRVVVRSDLDRPDFVMHLDSMKADLLWPSEKDPADYEVQEDLIRTLMNVTGSILAGTCYGPNLLSVVDQLFHDELAPDRISILTVTPNNYHRVLGRSFSRLTDHMYSEDERFPLRDRPNLNHVSGKAENLDGDNGKLHSHRASSISSVIDVHLWDRANWRGTGFFVYDSWSPPVLALLFEDRQSAERIFLRWHERFGPRDSDEVIHLALIRDISPQYPSHYEVLVTSRLRDQDRYGPEGPTAYVGRHLTVTAETSVNLDRFLDHYRRTKTYLLAPAILKEPVPEPLVDIGILKQRLSVKRRGNIGAHDIEAMVFPSTTQKDG